MIACYKCHAACAHCMYGCSPELCDEYVTQEAAEKICATVRRLGCRGMHIGGGEPFLNAADLVALIKTMKKNGVDVDYVETNAAWISGDNKKDLAVINEVMISGRECIMVSADFFHIEFIPFSKPKYLIDLLARKRIPHFVWQQRYLPVLMKLDPHKTYTQVELIGELGHDAVLKSAREYGMGFNGRALNLIRQMGKRKPAADHLPDKPCDNLTRTDHFHADLYGNYIPPGCTGMGIPIDKINKPLDISRYPIVARLFSGGLKELYRYAVSRGFEPDPEGYVSKCELCFAMRKFLYVNDAANHPDITPGWYYRQNY